MKINIKLYAGFLVLISTTLLGFCMRGDSCGRQYFALENNRKLNPYNNLNEKVMNRLEKVIPHISLKEINRADLSYLFIDVKFDGNDKFKILEFGEAKQGGFRTFDGVFTKYKGAIWKKFWEFLTRYDLPIWFVDYRPRDGSSNKIGLSSKQRFSWSTFQKLRGHYSSSLEDLENDSFFKSLVSRGETSMDDIRTYKAIVVFRYRDDLYKSRLKELEDFKSRYPEVLFLDGVSRPYAASKEIASYLFRDNTLEKFRPRSALFPKVYTPDLSKNIIETIGGSMFVIKPVNSGMSNGVLITEKKNLDRVLKRIMQRINTLRGGKSFNYRPTSTQTYGYWTHDENDYFLVEEYVPSKIITVDEKRYDPTMRVVFVMEYNKGKIAMHFLEAWWKLAKFDLDALCDETDKHVSKFRPDLARLPQDKLRVLGKERDKVIELMNEVMPKAYEKMIKIAYLTPKNS